MLPWCQVSGSGISRVDWMLQGDMAWTRARWKRKQNKIFLKERCRWMRDGNSFRDGDIICQFYYFLLKLLEVLFENDTSVGGWNDSDLHLLLYWFRCFASFSCRNRQFVFQISGLPFGKVDDFWQYISESDVWHVKYLWEVFSNCYGDVDYVYLLITTMKTFSFV